MKFLSFLLSSSLFLLLATLPFLGIVPRAHADSSIIYGTFFYVWYPDHFNGNPPPPLPHSWWNVTDEPLMGWYSSNDPVIIKEQFAFMHYAGINLVLISYWNDTETDAAMLAVFQTVNNSSRSHELKLAINVEPYNESSPTNYNFATMESYLYTKFASPFSDIYFQLDNKPLLLFSQGGNMTNPQANRDALYSPSDFTVRIYGDMPYANWSMWYPSNSDPKITTPRLMNVDGGQTTIEPRYDDSYLGTDPSNGQVRNTTEDAYLTEGFYQSQWNVANAWIQAGECHIVLMGTWNDYTERTQIEPCFYEKPQIQDPFYLLNITRANVFSNPSTNTLPVLLLIASGILGAIIASGIVALCFLKVKKKS
jgi:hypothetical protein